MSQVSHVIVDEVDTMMTQGFAADIEGLTKPILTNPARREDAQFVFVTATLTRAVRKLLDEGNFPNVREKCDLYSISHVCLYIVSVCSR